MSGVRQSKRLKGAAAAVPTASASAAPRSRARKSAASASAALVAGEAVTSASSSSQGGGKSNSQAAWGALFAKKPAPKTAPGEAARPRSVDGVPAELQARVDAFPAFEGVSRRESELSTAKIVAWNVNGLRAVLKRDESAHLRAFVAQEDPDVLCLSETKIGRDELLKMDDFLPQYEHQVWACAEKKGYSGTAVFSKVKPLQVKDAIVVGAHTPKSGKGGDTSEQHEDREGRFLALEFADFWVVHTYVPNAGGALERLDYRTTQWDRAIERELCAMEKDSCKPVVWCGDLNVAHEEIDIHDPKGNRNKSAGFTDQERESFSQLLAAKSEAGTTSGGLALGEGFVDTFRELHPEEQQYSYFSYRFNMRARNKGWRLDYFVASRALLPLVTASYIRGSVTGSDHVPIGLELKQLKC